MRMILDLEQIVRAMNISEESFAAWKAANLDQHQDGGVRWHALEESGFLDQSPMGNQDLKTG